eukprot:RCo036519
MVMVGCHAVVYGGFMNPPGLSSGRTEEDSSQNHSDLFLWSNELWALNMDTLLWRHLNPVPGGAFPRTSGHTATMVEAAGAAEPVMVVIGGQTEWVANEVL